MRRIKLNSESTYKIYPHYHVIFWAMYFFLNTLRWGSYFNDYNYSLKTNLIGFPIHMILCYATVYVLIPNLLFRKKYFFFICTMLLAIFLMVVLKFNLTYFLVSTNVWPEGPSVTNDFTLNYAIDMMIGELYVVTFVTAIKITLHFLKEHQRVAHLEKANLESQLLFLRTQISPHFFFKSL